jgi:hypothetical protein
MIHDPLCGATLLAFPAANRTADLHRFGLI